MNDGTGRSLFDYDDDGRLDIFLVNGAPLIGVAAGDYDNDGYEDLYVTANGGNRQGPTDADDPRACQTSLLADLRKNCPNPLKWRSIMIQGELSQCAKRVEAAL